MVEFRGIEVREQTCTGGSLDAVIGPETGGVGSDGGGDGGG